MASTMFRRLPASGLSITGREAFVSEALATELGAKAGD
jgi:hypothetical protein